MENNMSKPGLTCKPRDHVNQEVLKPSSIKKFNFQPI